MCNQSWSAWAYGKHGNCPECGALLAYAACVTRHAGSNNTGCDTFNGEICGCGWTGDNYADYDDGYGWTAPDDVDNFESAAEAYKAATTSFYEMNS